jgi:hypothetical protein
MTGFVLWVLLRSDLSHLEKWKAVASVPEAADCAMLANGMNEDLSLHPASPLMFLCSDPNKTPDSIRR